MTGKGVCGYGCARLEVGRQTCRDNKTPEVRQLTLGRGVSVSLLHSCTPKAPGLLHSSCGCMYGHERKEGVGQGAAHSLSPGAPSLQALAGNSSCATAFGEYLNYL